VVLSDILYKVNIRSVAGSTGVDVNDIQIDSRKVKPGGLFVAVKGGVADGHQFIEKAYRRRIVQWQLLTWQIISSVGHQKK